LITPQPVDVRSCHLPKPSGARFRKGRFCERFQMPVGRDVSADFDAVPMISKAQVKALAAGDSWLENGDNLLCFCPLVAPNRGRCVFD
jgi:hypothetical protein